MRHLRTERLLRIAVWCAFLVVISFTSADPDLWGHVRFGLDMLRDGHLQSADTYSFTSDRTWVNHEWAAEVFAASAYKFGGDAGLVLLKLVVVGAVLLLLDMSLRRQAVTSAFARDVTAGATIVMTLSQAHHIRPQLFSLLFFSVLLACLLATRRGSLRTLLILPPLFGVWANFHGGWIVGGAVLILWTVGLVAGNERRLAIATASTGALSLLATLATPYGLTLWRFLYDTVGLSRPEIIEWQPLYVVGPLFVGLWATALAVVVLSVILGGREHIQVERILVAIVLAALSMKVSRLIAFFGLSAAFLFAPAIWHAYGRRNRVAPTNAAAGLRFGFAALACGVAAAALLVVRDNFWQLRLDTSSMPRPEAVRFLENEPAGKRVLVWFSWGEYAIWHLSPRMQVSIDGRRETVYSESVQTRHFDFFFDRGAGASLPDDLAADYVWIPRILPAVPRLETDRRWIEAYKDDQSVIFVRAGLPSSGTLPVIASASTNSRIFPGP